MCENFVIKFCYFFMRSTLGDVLKNSETVVSLVYRSDDAHLEHRSTGDGTKEPRAFTHVGER